VSPRNSPPPRGWGDSTAAPLLSSDAANGFATEFDVEFVVVNIAVHSMIGFQEWPALEKLVIQVP
jgi:hypothetical protein